MGLGPREEITFPHSACAGMNCDSGKEGCSCAQQEDAQSSEEDETEEPEAAVADRPTSEDGDSMEVTSRKAMSHRIWQAKRMAEYSRLETALGLAREILAQSTDGRSILSISEQAEDVLSHFDAFPEVQSMARDGAACSQPLQSLVTHVLTRLMDCAFIGSLRLPYHRLEHPLMWTEPMFPVTSCVIGLVPPGIDLSEISRMSFSLPCFQIDSASMRLRPFLLQRWLQQFWSTLERGELHVVESFFNEWGGGRHAELVGVDTLEDRRLALSASLVIVVPITMCDGCVETLQRRARASEMPIFVLSGVIYGRPKSFFVDSTGSVSQKRQLLQIEAPPPAIQTPLFLTRAERDDTVREAQRVEPTLRCLGTTAISTHEMQGRVQQLLVTLMSEAVSAQRAKEAGVVGEQALYAGGGAPPISVDIWANALSLDGTRRLLAVEVSGSGHNTTERGVAKLHRQARRDLRLEIALRRLSAAVIIISEPWAKRMHKDGRLEEELRRKLCPLLDELYEGTLDVQQVHHVPADDRMFTTGVYPELRAKMEQPICLGELQPLPIFANQTEMQWLQQEWQLRAEEALQAALDRSADDVLSMRAELQAALDRATCACVKNQTLLQNAMKQLKRLKQLEAAEAEAEAEAADAEACQAEQELAVLVLQGSLVALKKALARATRARIAAKPLLELAERQVTRLEKRKVDDAETKRREAEEELQAALDRGDGLVALRAALKRAISAEVQNAPLLERARARLVVLAAEELREAEEALGVLVLQGVVVPLPDAELARRRAVLQTGEAAAQFAVQNVEVFREVLELVDGGGVEDGIVSVARLAALVEVLARRPDKKLLVVDDKEEERMLTLQEAQEALKRLRVKSPADRELIGQAARAAATWLEEADEQRKLDPEARAVKEQARAEHEERRQKEAVLAAEQGATMRPDHGRQRDRALALQRNELSGQAAVDAQGAVGGRPRGKSDEFYLSAEETILARGHGEDHGFACPPSGWKQVMQKLNIPHAKLTAFKTFMDNNNLELKASRALKRKEKQSKQAGASKRHKQSK